MGFAIDDDRLLYVYNLGGNEAKLHVKKYVTASNPNEAIMDRVVLERIYQHATIQYIKSYTSSKPSAPENYNYNTKAERHTLFNLDPKDVVFYVGGYPKDFRPPTSLNYPNFKGCIEFDYLNQIGVSLYNFKRTFNLNTTEVEPCRRHKRDSGENYFEGFGYANLSYKLTTGKSLLYEQSIQTTVDSGLLLFAEDNDNYISLNIEGGILVLKYKINSDTVKEAKSNGGPINNGNDYLIGVRLSVKDRGIRITHTGGLISLNDVDFFSFSTYYMGGVPSEIREKFNIKTPAFRGCVKNVKTPVGTAKFQGSYGVSRKCFDGWKTVRDAEFSRGGTLGLKSDNFPFPGNFQASFGFQTLETNADMFTHVAQSDDLSISLEEGTVTVNTRNTELQSTEKYLDGKRHYVSVIRNDDRLSLLVDDEPVTEKVGSVINIGRSTNDLYFGGKNFEGCISDVFIQRTGEYPTVQNLHDNNEKKQVSLGTCMVEEPPVPLILNEFKVPYPLILNDKDMNYIDIMTNAYRKPAQINQQGCIAHSNLSTFGGAYQFGDIPDSILLFKMNNPLSQERSHFSLDVRTMEPAGLILMMRDQYESTHLTLHLSKGRFVLSLGIKGHKIKIRSQDKYNDGKWHTVVFSWDGFNGRLVIDGLKSRKGSLTRKISLESMSSVHLGGVPSLKLQGIPKKSFIGCVRNVQVDGTPLEKPSQVLGVLPCYDGSYETGVFFAEDGGHIIVEKNFVLMPEFEMALNVRPRSQTGVIMHSGTGQGDRLSLYMDAGKVTLSLSRGGEDFQVSVTPLALCDGQWHRITASLTKNALVLDVDNQSKQTTGPSLAMYKSTTAPFYVGGVPATSHTPGMPVKSSFVGCMKDVKMNKKLITFRKISELNGAISLSRCPAA